MLKVTCRRRGEPRATLKVAFVITPVKIIRACQSLCLKRIKVTKKSVYKEIYSQCLQYGISKWIPSEYEKEIKEIALKLFPDWFSGNSLDFILNRG